MFHLFLFHLHILWGKRLIGVNRSLLGGFLNPSTGIRGGGGTDGLHADFIPFCEVGQPTPIAWTHNAG